MKYSVCDVVLTTSDYGSRVFVIVEVLDAYYAVVSIGNKKRYKIKDIQIQSKVGVQDISLLGDHFEDEEGRDFCCRQAEKFPAEAYKWLALSKFKNGDDICLTHRKTIFPNAEFIGINLRKSTYPIRAKIKGQDHDFSLNSFLPDFTVRKN